MCVVFLAKIRCNPFQFWINEDDHNISVISILECRFFVFVCFAVCRFFSFAFAFTFALSYLYFFFTFFVSFIIG